MSDSNQPRRRKIAGERRTAAPRVQGHASDLNAESRSPDPSLETPSQPADAGEGSPALAPPASPVAGNGFGSPPVWLLAGLALLLVAALVFDVIVALKHHNDEDSRNLETTAIASAFNTAPARAEKAATAILSYDYQTLDQDAASAVKYMTPQAAADYQLTLREVVSKPATAVKAHVTAKVMLSGVASARPDEVDVLLFVDQTSSTTSHRDPQTSLNRVVFSMVKSGDAWLVDKITAL